MPVKLLEAFRHRVVRNASWLIFDRVFRVMLSMVVTAFLARYLGPERLGYLNFAQALVIIVTLVANLGLEGIVVREIARDPQNRLNILASAIALRVVAAFAGVVACSVFMIMLRPGDWAALRLVALCSLALLPQVSEVIEFSYQADVNSRPIVLIRNAVFTFSALLRLAAILLHANLYVIAGTFVGEAFIACLFLILRARRDGLRIPITAITRDECRRLFKLSWPLIVANASVALYVRIDQIMVEPLAGDRQLGLYAAAVRLSEGWYLIPTALLSSAGPVLATLWKTSPLEYERQLLKTSRLLTAVAIAAGLTFTMCSPLAIEIVYGAKFEGAASVLTVHTWSGVFVCMSLVSGNWLLNTGHLRFIMYQTLIGAALNIALNFALVPTHGAVGAAFATLISYGVANVVAVAVHEKTRPLFKLLLKSFLIFSW